MATTVYNTVTLILQDGSEVTVKPLSIKDQRRATEILAKFSEEVAGDEVYELSDIQLNDKFIDTLIEVAKLSFAKNAPEVLEYSADDLLDLLDTPTLTEIVRVAASWNFDADSPKAAVSLQAGRSWT